MRQDICTIPVSEVFEPKDGCPLCRLRDVLEQRMTEYITGSAMMEPDVRIDTNHSGFCHRHFERMLQTGSRLSNALLLESHLKELRREIFVADKTPGKKELQRCREVEQSCFVCRQVEWGLNHMLETVYQLWLREEEFRTLYREQPFFCLPHARRLMEGAAKQMPRGKAAAFVRITADVAGNYLENLQKEVTHFCSMYDYRNRGGDWGTSRDAVERSIQFLTAYPVESGEQER